MSASQLAKSLINVYPNIEAMVVAANLEDRKKGEPAKPYAEYQRILKEREQAVAKSLNLPIDVHFENYASSSTQYFAVISHHAVMLLNDRDGLFVGVLERDLFRIGHEDAIVGVKCDSFEIALTTFLTWSQIECKAMNADDSIEAIRQTL